jgi:hypothetical protein
MKSRKIILSTLTAIAIFTLDSIAEIKLCDLTLHAHGYEVQITIVIKR